MHETPAAPAQEAPTEPVRSAPPAERAAKPRRLSLGGRSRALLWHLLALLLYALLSVGLSWPLAAGLTTHVSAGYDTAHNIWRLWQVRQALLDGQPLFEAPLLYYPRGITLLIHGVGPLCGLLALPFWPLGVAAAYNGAVLLSLTLTGYCMYLLARGLGFDRQVAFVAGAFLLASPLHIAGLAGHIEKLFLGLLPLNLLALHHALNPERSPWWAFATALTLLGLALHSGYQFIYGLLATALFSVVLWRAAGDEQRRRLLRPAGLVLLWSALLVGPLLVLTLKVGSDPTLRVAANLESARHQPDALQLLLPPTYSLLFGERSLRLAERFSPPPLSPPNLETEISLPLIGLLLCLIAWLYAPRPARRWILFACLSVLLALGHSLRIAGISGFTAYRLPIILPYAFFTSVPGLDFMRVPGRFMMLAAVGLAIGACYGLAYLLQRFPRARWLSLAGTLLLLLGPTWPRPWSLLPLPPVPPFYQQLALDPETYGVFDLPLPGAESMGEWSALTSPYQLYQITHGKGIHGGYLSRGYLEHPLFSQLASQQLVQSDITLNGAPTSPLDTLRSELLRLDYRYVVQHTPMLAGAPEQQASTRQLIERVFQGEAPVFADDQTLVYAVAPSPPALSASLSLGQSWRPREPAWRWATSPATLIVYAPRQQRALLEITPYWMHDPGATTGVGLQGELTIQLAGFSTTVPIAADQPLSVPLTLEPGAQQIVLSLRSGNFQPSDYGGADQALLSFAIRSINLQLLA